MNSEQTDPTSLSFPVISNREPVGFYIFRALFLYINAWTLTCSYRQKNETS